MATQTGPNILLLAGNPPQGQRQTLPQSKGLEKNFQETNWSSHSNIG